MGLAPISLAMIVRNESPHVEELWKLMRPHVAEIVVVDTGSEDDTPQIAERYANKVEVFTACNDAQGRIANFSMARERSFELATQPWVMWLDADDQLTNPELLERIVDHPGDGPMMALLPYDYAHDQHGNVTCQFWRERIVRAKEHFRWLSPVHEVLAPKAGDVPKFMTESCRVVHRRQRVERKGAPDPQRNLRILKAWYAEHGEKDARQLYYLGLECGNAKEFGNAIMFHKRYVALSGWEDEKCLSCLELAKLYQMNDPEHGLAPDLDQAIEWALRAITIREDWGEPYFSLAKSYYLKAQATNDRRHWERCARFAKRYIETPPTRTVLFINPAERAVEVHRYLNIALNWLGDVAGALASCEAGLGAAPGDGNMQFNRVLYVEHLEKQSIERSLKKLVEVGKMSDEAAAIAGAVVQGKFNVRSKEEVQAEAGAAQRPAIEFEGAGLDVVIYTGLAYERWNPETIAKGGLGGSETMAWEMSRRLARLGHRVRVYADASGLEGTFEGVEWLDHARYGRTACDVLITSRRPSAVDDAAGVEARARLCWVHDVHCGAELNYARALRIDRFLCLSEWHRDFFLKTYRFVHPRQVLVTRNGIDLSLYEQAASERAPHRIIASSSPDRYLRSALTCMPAIRARVPEAELHVYYGFDNWKKHPDPQQVAAAEQLERDMLATEGVVYHGRVSEAELARAQLAAGVWGYSTWFSETACLTAMQAQAAGLRIVTSPIAALNETVGARGTMIQGDWMSDGYRAAYVDAVVAAMQKEGDEDRRVLQAYARENFGLDQLARDWHVLLHRTIQEVERELIPPYQAVA